VIGLAARRRRFVDDLVSVNPGLSGEWRAAFLSVPRHRLVPCYYREDGKGGYELVDGREAGRTEEWLDAVYSDDVLAIQVREPSTVLSTSSRPSVMWEMLDALDVQPGHRVLEIGTGSGYNAALLCARTGAENVTTIDIDEQLAELARVRLRRAGFRPTVACADGAGGYPAGAPYDRILSTCAVPRLPRAWVEQTRPGGVVCAVMPHGMVRLDVGGAGDACGRFHPTDFWFMPLRREEPDGELSAAELFSLARSEGKRGRARTPAIAHLDYRSGFWMLAAIVGAPGLIALELGDGAWVDEASRSWARLDGEDVVQGGPMRLWDLFEQVHTIWELAGRPERTGIGLTVTTNRQWLWLNEPESGYRWLLT
jgi:protein-L-isoaspartate(D-aspartate) O-methyltransferase